VYTKNKYSKVAQDRNVTARAPGIRTGTGARAGFKRRKMAAKVASAVPRIKLSTTPASKRELMDAEAWGKSAPTRLSSWVIAGSIKMPPRAGGGGQTSGASTMRGRSVTGSASSGIQQTGMAAERGNSMTLVDASVSAAIAEWEVSTVGVPSATGWSSIRSALLSRAGRGPDQLSAESKGRNRDGYRGARGLRRARYRSRRAATSPRQDSASGSALAPSRTVPVASRAASQARCSCTAGSAPVELSINPVFEECQQPEPGQAHGRDHKTAQLCFPNQPRAKVNASSRRQPAGGAHVRLK